ncbi:ATP-binding cassette domain-containing protein [Dietzia sp. ANT_WB102]|uniref:branched-chain amino acid ABC transporter ATP-binding protein/permease n=1 Tax=Dietzia sp. ANT_WB102 TaxID=2597345 RepID=UPI0011ED9043|nr:ATP-binding cassette domain-containing protein [Dietzia sp. ANT_WB102]KAA0918449.1 ATP-binding cassette domain-containing protein [Dietzia sp. ANT_WB102]
MSSLRKFAPAIPLLLVVVLLVGPSFGLIGAVAARDIMLVAVLALMVSGLNLVLGYAGELAVGQVAFYAIGAYIAGFVGVSLGQTDLLIGLVAVIIGAIVVGLLTGVPSLRLSGWPLAMVTFFLVLIVPNLIEIFGRWTGGGQGMAVDRATFFGSELGAYGYYIVVVVVTALWFLVVRNTILSPHGTGFLVLRQSPELAGALGLSVYRTKLKVYVLGAIAPALGGALFAWMDGFIAPDSFTFGLAITLLAASVLGGGTSIYGALLGAAVLHFTEDSLTGFNQYQLIIFGLLLVVLAIALPDGAVGLLRRWFSRVLPASGHLVTDHSHSDEALQLDGMRGAPVVVDSLDKSFGGNHAVRGVSFTARPGEITALIGTNGSGKTTVLNMINGFLRPDSGTVRLGEGDQVRTLSSMSVDAAARAGVMRTFQTPIMPAGVTTVDFVALGGYLTDPASLAETVLRLPGHRRRVREATIRAERLLGALGLADVMDKDVDSLPLGNRRLVEVARSLAASPSVLLLDEVGSGLDEGDLARLEDLLRRIRDAGVTIILVEHNFPLVMRLADHVHVLSRGTTLVEGAPSEIRDNPDVATEYLGTTPENTGGAQ